MSVTKQARVRPTRPALPTPFRPEPSFPSLTSPAKDLAKRADETVRRALTEFPSLAAIDWFPSVTLVEKRDEFVVTAEIPGVEVKDISIDFTDGVLTVRGERAEAVERKVLTRYVVERQYGAFERTLPLGTGIATDRIAAELSDGILKIRIPKTDERKSKRREIPIVAR